uniref:Proteasome assembly chaperone 2 n=1 Tax=Plectus sambesii TaxID=2011161 RepID=A0A914W0T9_9BILA
MLLTSDDEASLSNYAPNMTLILPAISVGNVGQLAVDLLISSLDLELIAHSPANKLTLPLVGPSAYIQPGSKQLSTAVEVYSNKEKTLLVVQQRSDFISHARKEFLDSLVEWIVKMKIKRVVLLSSAFLSSQLDSFLQCSEVEKTRRFLSKAGSAAFPSVDNFEQQMVSSRFDDPKSLRGAGISTSLFQRLDERNVAMLALVRLCNEGEDNVADAVAVVNLLNDVISLKPVDKEWKRPISWMDL